MARYLIGGEEKMKPRVILFHEEESVRVLLSSILKTRGYDVSSFSEPESCPLYTGRDRICDRSLPEGDALIVGDRLPRMSGLNFLRLLADTGCDRIFPNRAVMAATWPASDLHLAKSLGCKSIKMASALEEIVYWLEGLATCGLGRWESTTPACPLLS